MFEHKKFFFFNFFATVWVNPLRLTLSKEVAEEMREHENEVTQSTQEYVYICHNLWEIFNGKHPITIQDPQIGRLDNVSTFQIRKLV